MQKCPFRSTIHFVIVPFDKANGNVALVYKRFYASVLDQELGLERKKAETEVENNQKDLKKKKFFFTKLFKTGQIEFLTCFQ